MGKSLILAVKIIGDANSAIAAMDQVSGKSSGMGNALGTAAKWSTAALAGIAAGAVMAGAAASDLEQSTGAVASVFGTYADEMTGYAEKAAGAVGLSQNQYNESAVLLGAQLKNMGVSMEEVSGTTNDLIGLGADLAATFGGTTADATAALSSLLRGERDPIEKYGVSIKQADIDAQKLAMGLDGLTGEAAKNADMQATLALLTAQTADAQGQFARETDSAAGAAQIAAANYENAKAALGEALLPIMAEASDKLADLAKWFQENASWITPLVGALAGLAGAIIVINGAYKAYAAIQAVQTAAQWANNAAWLASPITWIILAVIAAIALLVVAIVWVVQNWDLVKEKAAEVWQAVIDWISGVVEWIDTRFQLAILAVLLAWEQVKAGAAAVWDWIIGKITEVIQWIQIRIVAAIIVAANTWNRIKETAAAVWQAVIDWINRAIGFIRDGISNAINNAIGFFQNMGSTVSGVFQNIIDWVKTAIDWIANLARNAVPGWAKDLLGMSRASFMIQPEVMGLEIPAYAARMSVTPQVESYGLTTPDAYAPMAAANLGAMTMLATAMITARQPRSSSTTTVYEDKRTYEINLPNYLGDKEDVINELRAALKDADRNSDRIITA